MSKFTRPTFNVDDDDLERLQKEFFEKETMPSAKVYRTNAPPSLDKPVEKKKRSLFSERLASGSSSALDSPMPALEMPSLEESVPVLEKNPNTTTVIEEDEQQQDEFEPVMDPNPEPHVPVSKKMIDLTSLLGQVLGEIKEHDVKEVSAPTLPIVMENKPARGQVNGFPKPVHRSEFKKRLEAQRNKSAAGATKGPRPEAPPQVMSEEPVDENDRRIHEMSQQELDDAREEIMSTLSPESIALLMKGLKSKNNGPKEETSTTTATKKKVSFEPHVEKVDDDKEDLLQMKKQYFADVPMENDKLAWMDNRFLTPEIRKQEAQRLKELEEENNESEASEVEKVYRKVRFDLQGRIIDNTVDIPRHKGLHHHGDEPEKAGYTLAELFYLVRSQVPSQRSMVLITIARIITIAKKAAATEPVWNQVLAVFTGKEHSATIYLRSALDDRNLIVLVSAIKALAALVLDDDDHQAWEESLLDSTEKFNRFLGHIVRPILPAGVTEIKRKGLNDKLTELVDRVRQTSGQPSLQEQKDDAALAERDLVRGLVKMDLLARIRYLLASESSELIQHDAASVDRLVRIVVRMAEAGQDVCESIEEEELLEPIVHWGVANTQWPMTEDDNTNYPSLAAVRLLTVLAQGSKQIAESIVEKATITLRFLVTSPETACDNLKRRAYALQLETLKLIRVLACYGFIVPTLEDLQGPLMGWLRSVLQQEETNEMNSTIASTAIGLLEVLLYAAADPHKTIPAHAIDWHQPTAYLPAITAVLRASRDRDQSLYESALGYLGAWASHIELFPPELGTVNEVWKAVIQEDNIFQTGNSVALGYTTSTNHVLRYMQFIAAYTSLGNEIYRDIIQDAQCKLKSAQVVHLLKECYSTDMLGRYALWIWLDQCKEREKCWGMSLGYTELESGIRSKQIGIVETWLAQELLHLCLSSKQHKQQLSDLEPFYLDFNQQNVDISKSLFNHDGRSIKTLMYISNEETESNSLETTAFILSPIDALYHLDKSKVAQKSQADAASIVSNTIELANKFFYTSDINHDVAMVTLMKIFLIGDREGRQADMISEREVFMDERVSKDIDQWLDYLCRTKTNLAALENAWRRSSEYIRQAQVPFFQFYQGFVAQYAAVSFGHHGFARLLVYLVTQIDTIDYRHLVLSDYRDILATLKVGVNQVPQLSLAEKEELDNAGLKLLDV